MRILFLTQRLPYAPNRGDRVRAYHELRALAARHQVHVASLVHDDEEASHAPDLSGLAASVSPIRVTRVRNWWRGVASLPTARPLTHVLLDGPSARRTLERIAESHHPDLVFAYCSSMARFALEPPLGGLPFVMDMVDVDSAKWAALGQAASFPKRWVFRREARLLGRFEADATRAARATWVVNAREASLLRDLAGPGARVLVAENGVDTKGLRPEGSPSHSDDVVFCGVMDYAPNEQGAIWLATKVWPLVRSRRPPARLLLVGANPTRRLRDLAARDRSVVVTGTVPDVRPYLWNGAVSAAPLHVARGVQNKVLEAVAAGLPAVITSAVAGGLPPEVMPACTTADSPASFADALVRLLAQDPEARRATAASAPLEALTWESRLAPMIATVEELANCGVR